MKNIAGRKFSSIRCHASIKMGAIPARSKEENTIVSETHNVEIDICPAGVVLTYRENGNEVLIPYSNITQGTLIPLSQQAAGTQFAGNEEETVLTRAEKKK